MFVIEVMLGNADHRIRPGMIASAVVPSSAGSDRPVTTVPLGPLIHRGANSDAYAVFVLREGGGRSIVHLQTVETGSIEGNNVAIRNGLKAGMKVVIRGNDNLVDGETVTEVQ
jgi:hypothetical protein